MDLYLCESGPPGVVCLSAEKMQLAIWHLVAMHSFLETKRLLHCASHLEVDMQTSHACGAQLWLRGFVTRLVNGS